MNSNYSFAPRVGKESKLDVSRQYDARESFIEIQGTNYNKFQTSDAEENLKYLKNPLTTGH